MTGTTHTLGDLEARMAAGEVFTRQDAERVLVTTDLVSIGMLGEAARRQRSGDRVTFGRVATLARATAGSDPGLQGSGRGVTVGSDPGLQGSDPAVRSVDVGQAGEVRIVGVPASLEDAVAWVRRAAKQAAGRPLTGFSLPDLMDLFGHDDRELVKCAAALREAGLEAVAEVPIDRMGSVGQLIAVVKAVTEGGLGVWRLTVERSPLEERLNLTERAAALQKATGDVRAFAPLPRLDPASVPSTGYDDVRTIAIARLFCSDIPFIQVDWPLYGPKLAQVAIAFGANDIDGIAPVESLAEGPRRAPGEEIARQIRAASAVPAERNGRYEILA